MWSPLQRTPYQWSPKVTKNKQITGMAVENVTKTRLNPERGKVKESCCPIQEELNDKP